MNDTLKYALVGLGIVLLVLAFYFLALPALFSTSSTCPSTISPVCANDGRTYDNACLASAAGVSVASSGPCPRTVPVNTSTNLSSCSETDGGKDPNHFGTLTLGGRTYSDSCSSSTGVLEYMCSGGQVISEAMACASGFECQSGQCVASLVPTPPNTTITAPSVCSDSDGGANENVYGTATVSTSSLVVTSSDFCVDPRTVNEYACSGGIASSIRITCSSDASCASGVCVSSRPSTVSCTDSDSANSPTVAGIVTLSNGGRGSDTCTSSTGGIEYFCSRNDLAYQNFSCASGMVCDAGRCIATTSPPPPVTCNDPDGGENLFTRATTTNSVGGSESDQCNLAAVKEFSCAVNGSIVMRVLDCPSGYSCSSGACVSTSPACSDPDGGRDIYRATTVTRGSDSEPDSCQPDGVNVKEFFCTSGVIDSAIISCPSGFRCSAGACVGVTYAPSCTDSDSGSADPTTMFGSVSGYTTTAPYSHSDGCDGRNVKEWSCSGTTPAESSMTCALGSPCSAGACTLSCERPDPDSTASDAYTHGVTYDGARALPDSCLDSNTLRKFTCDSGRAVLRDLSCGPGAYCDAGTGKCIARCRDLDGGDNPTVSGTLYYGSSFTTDQCDPSRSGWLFERVCDASGMPADLEVKCSSVGAGFTCRPSGEGAVCAP